ncbi:MAG: lactate utilization protein [Candidatus Roizmanbacteria bacterium]|nr:lactate utilization protein [Candidatus Roizmanbacteria bacterium]
MDYSKVPNNETIEKTICELKNHRIDVILVDTKEQALKEILKNVPASSKIMNGSSTTLIQIGFSDLLKSGNHKWKNLHEDILKESDRSKQSDLRRKSITEADYFLCSVNAITEDGKLVAVDASGSRVGALPFAAKNVLIIAGANKIVPNIEGAFDRIKNYVINLENERAMKVYGVKSSLNKWIIIEKESAPNRIKLILVKESLGF